MVVFFEREKINLTYKVFRCVWARVCSSLLYRDPSEQNP